MKKPEIFYFKCKREYKNIQRALENEIKNKGVNELEKRLDKIIKSGIVTITKHSTPCEPNIETILTVNKQRVVELEEAKVFFIPQNSQDFYDSSIVKQNYRETLRLPFSTVFVSFEQPIKVVIGEDSNEDFCMGVLIKNFVGIGVENVDRLPLELQSIFKYQNRLVQTKEYCFAVSIFYTDYEETTFYFNSAFLPTYKRPLCYKYSTCVNHKKMQKYNLNDEIFPDCTYFPQNSTNIEPCILIKNEVHLLNLVINTINYLNAVNVKKIPYISSTKSLREKGGEEAIRNAPPEYYICKVEMPSPQYKQTKESSSDRRQFKFSFDVRGHFRHLQSDFYKHKKGQMIWVPPFVKGEGVYIPKSYHFIEKDEEAG